ncbi:hypothetical protein PAMP_023050 [Pampus punctatissimus]
MEHYFRITLGMLFLIVYLQAKPIADNPVDMSDLGIEELIEEVICNDCHNAALKYFMQGLKDASTKCKDENERIVMTLECLEHAGSLKMQTNSSECQWENNQSRKTLKEFVKDLKTLVELRNQIIQGQ